MRRLIRTLYGKLSIALLLLLGTLSIGFFILSVRTSQLYFHEVNQKLNQEVAAHMLAETPLFDGAKLNREELKHLFHTIMVVNPSLELYLVDPGGRILAYDAPRGKIKRDRVDLAPVAKFLSGKVKFPILGDDPKSLDGQKAFTVHPVTRNGQLEGYLYIVLGGQIFDSITEMIAESYILTYVTAIAAVCLLISLLAGIAVFRLLTRRLRRLNAGVELFRENDFEAALQLKSWRHGGHGDEIDILGSNVEQMSERIVDQINQLRAADDMRKEMLINISHDLRTPLTALNGYLETLRMRQDKIADDDRDLYLDQASKHARSISLLVNQIFELATLESGGLRPAPESFSLSELVQDVAQKFAQVLGKKGITLNLSIPPDTPNVTGDIALIERVLDNLIENAGKFTVAGGEVHLSLRVGEMRIEAEVADNGIGISAEELPHIFDRFYRSSRNVEGSAPDGNGLGLAITKRILQLHETAINVDSTPGAGSRFRFDLPVAA